MQVRPRRHMPVRGEKQMPFRDRKRVPHAFDEGLNECQSLLVRQTKWANRRGQNRPRVAGCKNQPPGCVSLGGSASVGNAGALMSGSGSEFIQDSCPGSNPLPDPLSPCFPDPTLVRVALGLAKLQIGPLGRINVVRNLQRPHAPSVERLLFDFRVGQRDV